MNRNKNTKELLVSSFKEQLLHTPFEKITVKMITDKAGVIRTTFYNYFKDKYEIFEYILEKELFAVLYALVENDLESEALKMIFTFFDKNRSFYKEAFKTAGQNSFEEILSKKVFKLCKILIKKHGLKIDIKNEALTVDVIAKYYAIGIVYVLKMWILDNNNEKITSEEVYDAYIYLITHNILEILE
ncbi:MAG: TetR family transcriptional regulator [Tissierellia bacterium]|nr:TetR family transcriptional regulator [Tissierellia bacterium]